MALFINGNIQSPVAAVEYISHPDGEYAFFHARGKTDAAALADHVKAVSSLEILSTGNGVSPVLIVRLPGTVAQLIRLLSAQGDEFREVKPEHKFPIWKLRGALSSIGQSFNLASSVLRHELDTPKMGFAASNLAANGVNVAFGGQKMPDVHRLHAVKTAFNALIAPYLRHGASLPAVDAKPAAYVKAKAEEKPKTLAQKSYGFMQRYSVVVGEIGLRYLGALAMVFPVEQWKQSAGQLMKGKAGEALKKAINPKPDKTNLQVGIMYLIGMTMGLFSKVPDPYNPKPATTLDTIRETLVFRLGSWVQVAGAFMLARGSYKKGDTLGTIGGTTLMGSLTTRSFAPFGSREVNMDELYAHMAEGLAKVSADRLPEAVGRAAQFLEEQFRDKHLAFGAAFLQLRDSLSRYQGIDLYPQKESASMEVNPEPAKRFAASPPPAGGYMQRVMQPSAQSAKAIA